ALKLPRVEYVEEDAYVFAQSIPWNLGRIVPPQQPSSGAYSPPNKGDLVEIYLLDTGVRSSHREIEGRVLVADFESVPEEDGTRFHRQVSPEVPHAAARPQHPPAPSKPCPASWGFPGQGGRLVLSCPLVLSLPGLEFVEATLDAQRRAPPVVLLPFAGAYSPVLNAGCRRMAQMGVAMVAAAGNYKDDACLYSPASEPEVITVGATNSEDQPASIGTLGTNFGRCVDLFAPGDDIVGASSDCSTCFTAQSGTSQAAAHVAGELGHGPRLSLAELRQRLLHFATKNVMDAAWFPEEQRLQTPDSVAGLPARLGAGSGAQHGHPSAPVCAPRCCCGRPAPTAPLPWAGCSFRSPAAALGDVGRPVAGPGSGPSHCAGRTEAVAHALCCPAASLECRVKEHTSSGSAEKVTVSCDDGWTLTGCSAHSQSPGTMGAYAVDDTCVAASVPGSSATVAVAICCRSR
ncbi:PCSK9 convertase, partial [Glareola pratincola]|nr:PCSK9 convertase [Glareola pratincola]